MSADEQGAVRAILALAESRLSPEAIQRLRLELLPAVQKRKLGVVPRAPAKPEPATSENPR